MFLRERSSTIVIVLHLFDCIVSAGYIFLLTHVYEIGWSSYYRSLALFIFTISFVNFHYFQLYRPWRGQKFLSEFTVIVRAWSSVVGGALFFIFLLKISTFVSRRVLLTWIFSTPFILFLIHFVIRQLSRKVRSLGYNQRNAVIVGLNDIGQQLLENIKEIPWSGINIHGFFDDRIQPRDNVGQTNRLIGSISKLPKYLEAHQIDYVYIALPMKAEKKIFSLIQNCRMSGAEIFMVPDIDAFKLFNAKMQSLGDMLILDFNPKDNFKRLFDIFFSLAVLTFVGPFMLLIALVIKLEDRGPVLYRHKRVTSAGKPFNCLKFRTMRVDADRKLEALLQTNPEIRAEWESNYKLKNDPRITRIGKTLRKTSLDELPQFFNVLSGKMSIVGARPVVWDELCNYYGPNCGIYCSIKPGITGPWQVGKRSDTENYEERVQLDYWYILNNNIWMDLKIIFKTVWCVFTGRGAY